MSGMLTVDLNTLDQEKARYILTIEQFLEGGLLVPLFQPIVALSGNTATRGLLWGYEGTIRGPLGSDLHLPRELLAKANLAGVREQIELACCRSQLQQFVELGLPGKLFFNLSSGALIYGDRYERDAIEEILFKGGVIPQQLVVELTENISINDLPALTNILEAARPVGVTFALDNIRHDVHDFHVWDVLRPELVKVSQEIIAGIHASAEQRNALVAIMAQARSVGTRLIAQGIESEADFDVLKDLGVPFGQGYLLGRPSVSPSRPPQVLTH